mgnify:CR=1 FL=1
MFLPTINAFKKLVSGNKKLEDKIVLIETTYKKNEKIDKIKIEEIFKNALQNNDSFNKSIGDLDLRIMPFHDEQEFTVTPIYTIINS